MEKIKLFIEGDRAKVIFAIIIIILVGFGSFELGKLSTQTGSEGLKIEYQNLDTGQKEVLTAQSIPKEIIKPISDKNFFASSRGKKYYPVGCPAGKTLKMENRVYFKTEEEAKAAGYTLSSSCD